MRRELYHAAEWHSVLYIKQVWARWERTVNLYSYLLSTFMNGLLGKAGYVRERHFQLVAELQD